ncbi:DUF6233 domain-containing protein [Streptomyces mirabilis]|uniref:DUF6233 domain-containing protein n=1 Tax=Streptomyces mirabilis TaxID=68239 RepID=UPI00331BF957
MRVWHAMWLQRIDTKTAALQEQEAQQEQGQKNRPQEPDWIVELGIGNGRPPIEVHMGGCYAAGKRRRPVPRDEAHPLQARRPAPHPRLTSHRRRRMDFGLGPVRRVV